MDQANEQSNFDTTEEAADALMDYLEPENSEQEQDEDLDGNQPEIDEIEDLDESEIEEDLQDDEDEEEIIEDEVEPENYTIVIDGEDIQVSRDELLNGYQRQADYTRKTQELASQRKQADEAFAQQHQAIEQQAQQMSVLTQQLQQMTQADQNINWDQLMDEDPAQYMRLKEQATQRQQALYQANQHQQYLTQQAQAKQKQKHQEFVQAQYDQLLTEWPEWKDTAKATQGKQEINAYLTEHGFTTDEVSQLADFRTLKLIDKARKYDAIKSAQPAIKKRANKAPNVIKPRAGRSKSDASNDAFNKQMKRLKQSGSKDDAAAILANL